MAIEGSVSFEAYVPVNGIALYSDDGIVSGGDPTPPDGRVPGMTYLYWRYDPTAESNGITGHSWYSDIGGPIANTSDADFNATLCSMYYEQGENEVKNYVDSLFAQWQSRTNFMDNIMYTGTLSTLREDGCLVW